jgi:hypothetical protein
MLSLFPGRDSLRILWGPNGMHQLSGVVVTPLFKHLGMSSWHSFDGAIITLFKPGHALSMIPFGLLLRLVILCVVGLTIVQVCRVCSRYGYCFFCSPEKGARLPIWQNEEGRPKHPV